MDNNNQKPTAYQILTTEQKHNYNWLRTLTIGFGIVSIGIAIAVGGYMLSTNKSQPPTQPVQIKPISISPTAVKTNEISSETAN